MTRSILLAAAFAALAGPALAQTPVLRPDVTVISDLVRIGDLVENAGALAAVPVFRAPDFGDTGTVQAVRVVEAVRAHGLATIETRGIPEVQVTRASRALRMTEVEAAIAAALQREGRVADPASLQFAFDRGNRDIHLEAGATAPPRIERLFHDPRSGRFEALVTIPGSQMTRREPLRLSGVATETVEIVVALRPLDRGAMIRPGDVAIERRPRASATPEMIGALDRAVGMAARRAFRPGDMLRASDLQRPDLVVRNEPVTLVFEAAGLLLTVRARALANGAEGDIVSVLNLQSNRVLQAVVSGPGRVAVAGRGTTPAPGPVAASSLPTTNTTIR